MNVNTWPVLSYVEGKETFTTLHLFTQIVGKIKLKLMPWTNHSWHVVLFVTPTGLSTSHLPYNDRHFQIDFDFCQHKLVILTSESESKRFDLKGLSVAEFYATLFKSLSELSIEVKINKKPNEVADAILFDQDDQHKTYEKEQVSNLHKALLNTQQVFNKFRAEFKGKCSPIHFFWGSFDLALSRFSGRKAPKHPGGVPNLPDAVAEEAYSHEVSSCGFWPGNDAFPEPAFYAYTYPAPVGLEDSIIQPAEGYFNKTLGEFILPYEAIQKSNNAEEKILQFLRSTYLAGANLSAWDLEALH